MPRRRADLAPLGFTSNGILLVNVLAQLSEEQAAALRKALPAELGSDWFIGLAVHPQAEKVAFGRLDDAAAETAARLVAQATPKASAVAPASKTRTRSKRQIRK